MLKNIIQTTSNAKAVYITLAALYVLYGLVYGLSLPERRIVTHFSFDGMPNHSMTGMGFALFHGVMAVLIAGMRWIIAASARRQQGINIRGYDTFTDNQKQAFAGFMALHSWSFGCLMMGMLMMIDGVIFWTNTQTPTNLPIALGLALMFFLVGGIGWWIIRLLTEVQSIKKAGE
jgi:hypothetical protein